MNPTTSMGYRSANYPAHGGKQVGALHLHVDGPDVAKVAAVIEGRERAGHPVKMNGVARAVPGAQRNDPAYRDTYAAHTPTDVHGAEGFECFGTVLLANRDDAVATMRAIAPLLAGASGFIVEVEHGAGFIDQRGEHWFSGAPIAMLTGVEASLAPVRSAAYEIHHGIDLPAHVELPVSLSQLTRELRDRGVRLGGGFEFAKADTRAIRTNRFTKTLEDARVVATHEREIIRAYLAEKGAVGADVWTLVEQVVGIFRF